MDQKIKNKNYCNCKTLLIIFLAIIFIFVTIWIYYLINNNKLKSAIDNLKEEKEELKKKR